MQLKVVNSEIPGPVVKRFPYLESKLHALVLKDEIFRQLCQDYTELISTLKQTGSYTGDTRSDLLGLKTELEVEILEQVSRKTNV